MRAASKRVVVHGEVRIEYLAWGEPGPRTPVLLVPGMAAPADYWTQHPALLRALLEQGRRVLAVSLRGRGGSSCPAAGYRPEDHHADMRAVLDAEAVERAHVVGHSVGAAYALGLALARPEAVVSVTMGDHPPLMRRFGLEWIERLEAMSGGAFDEAFPRRIARESASIDYSPAIGSLRAPLLVLQGTQPGALLQASHVGLFERAPRVEIVPVDEGHDVFRSARALDALTAFLDAPEPGAP